MSSVSRSQAESLVGKHIYAVKRDGSLVIGRLVRINGNDLIVEPPGDKAQTKAILPLALFDVLAIGTAPFAFGGFGFGFPGFWW
ncbi:hypothetical protein [Cohnella caldifontis]|uniref:hypothetical protein n=1 Tax=Cohnella caldifontis TaxID=3027471 RepID=UPI0023EDD470|nr:hypothetical protein [Cohnella sp. YIM B05605]